MIVDESKESEEQYIVDEPEEFEEHTNEIESIENIPTGPILGLELEELDPASYPAITSPIKLCVGTA
ncbi:hypothetical protein F8M41_025186 [Gigaspora margarita]|uniref:Uncharacterized protein n=1 Tax=Gigaspora margarita TaxID=4874 RepID=A0A8H4ET75_GIGMA|nr:hypothetical protein F8M41_025186 [Gigaspora margarita]